MMFAPVAMVNVLRIAAVKTMKKINGNLKSAPGIN
jgi:hypothetical protein